MKKVFTKMGKINLVYGVGINNADYLVHKTGEINGEWKIIWRCPFYAKWSNMLQRCYSEKFHKTNPTYIGCSVVPEWYYFMTFRAWMAEQNWEGKQLDKDVLFPDNKVYGPDTCIFINLKLNSFFTECNSSRGE